MASTLLLLAMALLLSFNNPSLTVAEDWDEGDEDYVVELTASNFDKIVPRRRVSLVQFAAPWCNHCQDMKPDFQAAASNLYPTVTLGVVNVDVS